MTEQLNRFRTLLRSHTVRRLRRTGYSGVIRLCDDGSGSHWAAGETMTEYVYFIQAGASHGPVKVGHAADLGVRLKNLQVGSPERLSLLAAIRVDDGSAVTAEQLERMMHRMLKPIRLRGEWFDGATMRHILARVMRVLGSRDSSLILIPAGVGLP